MPAIGALRATPLPKLRPKRAPGSFPCPLDVSRFRPRKIEPQGGAPHILSIALNHISGLSCRPLLMFQTVTHLILNKKQQNKICKFSSTFISIRKSYFEGPSRTKRDQASGRLPKARLSNIGSWEVVFTIVFGSVITIFYLTYIKKEDSGREVGQSFVFKIEPNHDLKTSSELNMTGESLPGRPGNLTSEQEEKLRELWIVTLQVFGVLDSQHVKEKIGNSNIETLKRPIHKAETETIEKSKKKRISLFGRKHKDSDTESTTSTESGTTIPTKAAVDLEDKYGQTKQFHDTLAHQTPELLRATYWSMVKHDHPDALLLRFLRARKWDVHRALIMMISTMNWRATEMHVDDDIMKNGEAAALEASRGNDATEKRLGSDFLAQMRMGKSFLHGTDKSGRPMCFVRVRLHKQGEQVEASLERYTVFLIESARMVLAPPVDTACIVFDMTGFSMANMDYSPVKFMIKCFEANYPESLGVVLVHKAPWVFQGIWKIIKGWLDPVVASKVNFTNSIEDMEKYVFKAHIPKELGGDEDWSYRYIEPVESENDAMKNTDGRDKLLVKRETITKEFEKATLEWIDRSKESEASIVKERRHKLAADLRDDYWKLDPYIRARSLYDRAGMIQKGGALQFYPPSLTPPSAFEEHGNGAGNETAQASAADMN